MNNQKYFISNGISKEGPFDLEQLQRRTFDSSTMIWRNDFSDWKNILEVNELSNFVIKTPPILPHEKKKIRLKELKKSALKESASLFRWSFTITMLTFSLFTQLHSNQKLLYYYYNNPLNDIFPTYFSSDYVSTNEKATHIRWIYFWSSLFWSSLIGFIFLGFSYLQKYRKLKDGRPIKQYQVEDISGWIYVILILIPISFLIYVFVIG